MAKEANAARSDRRLGRGLSSLVINSGQDSNATADASYQPVNAPGPEPKGEGRPRELALADIAPNPYQPRRDFDEGELHELARSIEQQGVLQPLIVAPAPRDDADKPYILIAGERRLRAARLAGLETVPCMVRHAERRQVMEWAIIENIQRSDLNAIERANAYREYMDRFDITQAEAAERLGQARATVANHLRILDLDPSVRKLVSEGRLSFGHAKVLAGILDRPQLQRNLAKRANDQGLSVRQLEGLISAAQQQKAGTSGRSRSKPAHVLDLEERLTRCIGTRVRIQPGRGKHTGRLVVEYYSLDDFDRIAGALGLSTDGEPGRE